jgi:hypothetical protein
MPLGLLGSGFAELRLSSLAGGAFGLGANCAVAVPSDKASVSALAVRVAIVFEAIAWSSCERVTKDNLCGHRSFPLDERFGKTKF